ncbi:hypothetical protein ACYSNR_00420 [Enterococcus sp. LJL128]
MYKLMEKEEELLIRMGWSFISITNGDKKLILPIEQRIGEPDVTLVPEVGEFNGITAKRLSEILSSISWNREIDFIFADMSLQVIDKSESDVQPGTVESTEGGEQFLSLDLFNPENEISKEDVKQAWINLEERFAEAAEGFVTIYTHAFSENSVFNKITVPTLLNNEKVTLNFVENHQNG